MDQPFIGAIFIFSGNFAPQNYKLCQGQLLSISENAALFNLIGTTYGGDGQTTFGLPDLRGRVPVCQGQGAGLNNYIIGQSSGTETITLTSNQMPSHTHTIGANSSQGNVLTPVTGSGLAATYSGSGPTAQPISFYSTTAPAVTLNPSSISRAGGSVPFSIIQPVLTINYVIALFGIYPSQN